MSHQRLFYWKAIGASGQLQTGALLATDKNIVYEHIFGRGLHLLAIKRGKRLSSRYWRGECLITITRQLATLTCSPLISTPRC